MQHAGAVIRVAREARGLSLRQLAGLSGVHHSTISRIERGLIAPPPRTVKAITEAIARDMVREAS